MAPDQSDAFRVRRATADDSSGIVAIWQNIAADRIYSAIDQPWTVEQERTYLGSLSPREATHVAVDEAGRIIGFQSLDLFASTINSMRHVGQVGTHLLPEWRRRGVGRALFAATRAFARDAAYDKLVILVRASNESAQAFYRSAGFRDCGRLTRQVRIDGREDDEIIMELFLD
jgi:ribosomal protein S18 acetylase RimI-like enzyme